MEVKYQQHKIIFFAVNSVQNKFCSLNSDTGTNKSVIPRQIGNFNGISIASKQIAIFTIFTQFTAFMLAVFPFIVFAYFLLCSIFGVLNKKENYIYEIIQVIQVFFSQFDCLYHYCQDNQNEQLFKHFPIVDSLFKVLNYFTVIVINLDLSSNKHVTFYLDKKLFDF